MPDTIDPRTAWEPYRPSAENPWDLGKVGHLHRRAAFGANWRDLQTGLEQGPEKTIEKLLRGDTGLDEFNRQTDTMAESIVQANNAQQAKAWWLYRMLYTPHPLREKLTLFWHNHFATSNAKVQNIGHMLGQYRLMYEHALGKFDSLLADMSKDPAMMVWLDTIQSTKGKPNENYARELMELFSLGIGNYTEADIREAARAFTGWELRRGEVHFNNAQFDDTEKVVFGQRGGWGVDDIVRLCLEKDACPRFIVRKLYRFLISESEAPSDELINPLAQQFADSGYDFGKLVETVLRSNLFFSAPAYRAKIKSPVEFALGIVKGLEGRVGTTGLSDALEPLGQILFHPPSVKGWDGGTAWLNGQTLLFRNNLALALTSTEDNRFNRRCDPARLARERGAESAGAAVDFFLDLFLQGGAPAGSREDLREYVEQTRQQSYPVYWTEQDRKDHRIRAVCHLVLTLPEFQLC